MDDCLYGERGWRRGPKSRSLLDHHTNVRRDLELARSLGLTLQQFDQLPAAERDLWIAEWAANLQTCPQCKGPTTVCSDHETTWFPQRTVCYVSMTTAAANRQYDARHEKRPFHDGSFTKWASEPSARFPYHYRDGVTVWVSPHDLTPDNDVLS